MAATEALLIGGKSSPEPSAWDESGFESIFLEHYGRIVSVLDRLLGDRAQAEELANDVFCRLYRQRFGAGRDHNLGGWLYRTAMRLGLDWLRSTGRRRRYEQEAGRQAAASSGPATPLEAVLGDERRRQVRAALARLKPAHARLLMLRGSGLSYKELAETVGVKPSSIGTLLARAEAEFECVYRKLNSI